MVKHEWVGESRAGLQLSPQLPVGQGIHLELEPPWQLAGGAGTRRELALRDASSSVCAGAQSVVGEEDLEGWGDHGEEEMPTLTAYFIFNESFSPSQK